jgi:cytochrome c-type biogenesis protein CcmH
LAILRTTTGHWPLRFTLDDGNAMLPGRNLSSAQHVTIEARVSRSGGAAPQSGDYQSAVTAIDPHGSRIVHVVLDHVIG